jgi:hypothetical protein
LYTVYLQLVAWSCTLVGHHPTAGGSGYGLTRVAPPRRADQVSHLLARFFLGPIPILFSSYGPDYVPRAPIVASRIFVLWAGLFRFSVRP